MRYRNFPILPIAIVCCAAWLLPQLALGQQAGATLQGTITDISGASAPGAHVTLINTETNVAQSTQADQRGHYYFAYIPPGPYKLKVELAGFQTFVRTGVILQVQQQARIDVALKPGNVSTSVTVNGEAPRLDTEDATLGQVIERKTIDSMPLAGYNVLSLVTLTPGVHGDPALGAGGTGTNFYSNGTRNDQADIFVDGSSVTSPQLNGAATYAHFKPAVDATQEFKVMTNSFSAAFGQGGGTVVNIVLRSGTNQLHGDLYEFHRDNAMAANSWINNQRNESITPFRRNDFGASIGGPVYLPHIYNGKNRTFFFFNDQNMLQSTQTSILGTVPTVMQKSGDFSQTFTQSGALMQIFNPFTTHMGPDGKWLRDPFANNIIPPSLQVPMATKLISFYPDPNTQGNQYTNINNYFKPGSYPDSDHQYTVKIDENFNEMNRLSMRYSYDNLSHGFPDFWGNPQFHTLNGPQSYHEYNPAAEFIHLFSPTTILDLRWSLDRNANDKTPACGSGGCAFNNADYGFESPVNFQLRPMFNIDGFATLGPDSSTKLTKRELLNTFSGTVTKVIGRHTIEFGGGGKLDLLNFGQPGVNDGVFNLHQSETMQYKDFPNPDQGNGLATFLLGWASGSDSTNVMGAWAQKSFHLFVQDGFQVTPKLKLNLGLRWELDLPLTERFNRLAWVDLNAPTPITVPGYPNLTGGLVYANSENRSGYPIRWTTFAPRFGLAYRFAPKMVVRAGYGIFYDISQAEMHQGIALGYQISTSMLTSLDSGVTQYATLEDPFPDGLNQPLGSSLGLLTNIGQSIHGIVPSWGVKPYNEQWSLSIQRELPANSVIEISYSGNRGVHLYYNSYTSLDLLPTSAWALGTALNDRVPNPFYGIITNRASSLSRPTVQRSQLLLPHPQFTGISGRIGPPMSNSIYNGVAIKYTKRYSGGLALTASYTFSKMLDQNSLSSGLGWLGGGINDNGGVQYIDDLNKEWSISAFDHTHAVVASFTYQLPIGRGRTLGAHWNRVLDGIAGGWQVNGILSYTSGQPIALGLANGVLPDASQRPNLLCNPGTPGSVHARLSNYLNGACLSRPAPYTAGTAPRLLSTVRNPGSVGDDVSLFKNLYISREKQIYLQLRGEAFNVLNHPTFRGPNATFGSQSFGIISNTSNGPRQLEVAAKLYF